MNKLCQHRVLIKEGPHKPQSLGNNLQPILL